MISNPFEGQEPREQTLELHEIEPSHDLQPRESLTAEVVEDYGEDIQLGDVLPPVTIVFDGTRYWLPDGHHRRAAHDWAGKKSIRCLVFEGTYEQAKDFAYSRNTNRTNAHRENQADRRKKVRHWLGKPESLSDRAIAGIVGVDHKTVGRLRSEHVGNLPTSSEPTLAEQLQKRVGRDGKSYPASQPTAFEPAGDEEPHLEMGPDAQERADAASDSLIDLHAEDYRDWLRRLSSIASEIKEKAADPDTGAYVRDKVTRITTDLQSVRASVRSLEPVRFCEACHGQGCDKCRGTGFVTRGVSQAEGPQAS